jgi:hypothetical protein
MYKLYKNDEGKVVSVQLFKNNTCLGIPFAPDNTDYQEYLKWVAEGNQPLPADGE